MTSGTNITRVLSLLAAWLVAALLLPPACAADAADAVDAVDAVDASRIHFRRTQLDDKFRSEGAAVGDFNQDGKPDIAAGNIWYEAPNWTPHPLRDKPAEFDPLGYSDSFATFADDVNGDGWTDEIVVDTPSQSTSWYENPKGAEQPWARHVIAPVSNNESPLFVDLDKNGERALVMGVAPTPAVADGPDRHMAILRRLTDRTQPWAEQSISSLASPGTKKYSHGLGVGDINGDGRNDVLVPEGWWEAPAGASVDPWKFHPIGFEQPVAHMVVYDFDGDGRNDIACSSAHGVGMWWLRQTSDGWEPHQIDDRFSQSHSLCLADINGDGLPDLVTGKRWWAHGPKGDVNPEQPAVLYWYELQRKDSRPVWIPHEIDHDSGIGTQFEVADVNGDGLLDIVTSNKKGVFYFEQYRDAADAK
jgi:hypothetical protein